VYTDELEKPLQEYFKYKPGKRLIAPKTKENYYICKNHPDQVKIRITTFKGISPGAVHYYCSIEYQPIDVSRDKKGKCRSGGYMGGLEVTTNLRLELTREVTRGDLTSDPDRWNCYSVGDYTPCFNNLDELADSLIPFLEKHLSDMKYKFHHLDYDLIIPPAGVRDAVKKYDDF